MSTDGRGSQPFNRPRAIAGLMLIGLVIVLSLIDAIRPDYQVDSIQMAFMLGSALVLFGVEAGNKLLGR